MHLQRFVSVLLVLIFSFNVTAATGSGMKDIYDEYLYAMEVEGGFQDPEIRERATRKFESSVRELLSSGMSKQEIMEDALGLIKDENLREQTSQLLQHMIRGEMSETQVLEHLQRNISRSYNQGANWSGWKWVAFFILGPPIALAFNVAVILFFEMLNPRSCEGPRSDAC